MSPSFGSDNSFNTVFGAPPTNAAGMEILFCYTLSLYCLGPVPQFLGFLASYFDSIVVRSYSQLWEPTSSGTFCNRKVLLPTDMLAPTRQPPNSSAEIWIPV